MLIIEQTSNGRTTVRLHRDWSPSRIGKAYIPPPKFHYLDADACRWQSRLRTWGAPFVRDEAYGRVQQWTR